MEPENHHEGSRPLGFEVLDDFSEKKTIKDVKRKTQSMPPFNLIANKSKINGCEGIKHGPNMMAPVFGEVGCAFKEAPENELMVIPQGFTLKASGIGKEKGSDGKKIN